MKASPLLAAVLLAATASLTAAPLTQSTFTEIVREVNVVTVADRTASPAQLNALIKAPDVVRTGAASRAELTAEDQTITRVGANTVFSFEPAGRSLRLERGSLLFHSPSGKGGGTIKTGGASAAILGTTIIVAAMPNGGFKLIVLEGRGQAILPNGRTITLRAGQMVYILPGDGEFSPILDINLGRLVSGSQLINGFAQPLGSMPQINSAIAQQNRAIARGRAVDTGVSADEFASAPRIGNGLSVIDHTAYQSAVHPPLTPEQIGSLIDANGGVAGGPGGTSKIPFLGPSN